jgi:hypothetical protein
MNKKYNSNIEKQSWKIYLSLSTSSSIRTCIATKPKAVGQNQKKHTLRIQYIYFIWFRNNEGTSLKLVNLHRMQLLYTENMELQTAAIGYIPFSNKTATKQLTKWVVMEMSNWNKYAILDKAFPLSISIAPEFNRNQR